MAIEVKTLEDVCLILKRLTSSFNDLFDMSYNGIQSNQNTTKRRTERIFEYLLEMYFISNEKKRDQNHHLKHKI